MEQNEGLREANGGLDLLFCGGILEGGCDIALSIDLNVNKALRYFF